jgi:hypothetical protein
MFKGRRHFAQAEPLFSVKLQGAVPTGESTA